MGTSYMENAMCLTHKRQLTAAPNKPVCYEWLLVGSCKAKTISQYPSYPILFQCQPPTQPIQSLSFVHTMFCL